MAKRTETHEKATIACRAFEQALSPRLVAQPTMQGSDYGIDYLISVFVHGNIVRTYQVQVKYLNVHALRDYNYKSSLFHVYESFPRSLYGSYYFPFGFKKSTLRDYLNMSNQTNTLIVCANEDNLYSIWFDDYYDYFLKWLIGSLNGDGVIKLYFHGLRTFHRLLKKEYSDYTSQTILYPTAKDYDKAKLIYGIHDLHNNSSKWIDSWYGPGILDSVSSTGFSAYIAYSNNRSKFDSKFDIEGFWNNLVTKEHEQEYIFLCFANFIGCLYPTEEMKRWALNVILEWTQYLKIPTAFQILANDDNDEGIAKILTKLELIYNNSVGNLYFSFFDDEQGC